MSSLRIRGNEVGAEFEIAPNGLPLLRAVGAPDDQPGIRFRDRGARVVLVRQDRPVELAADRQPCRIEHHEPSCLRWSAAPAEGVVLQGQFSILGRAVRFELSVRNESSAPIIVRDAVLFETETDETPRGPTIRPDEQDPTAPVAGRRDAEPVFLGQAGFVGIDWPTAENATDGKRIRCRHFPAVTIEPGSRWQSRTCSIGIAAPAERPEQALLRHLDRVRARPTRRASFYFDWLTHASEGPTARQMHLQLDMFERLAKEFGIRFELYAVDDGAVETRWGLTFRRYRMRHDVLFPHGLEPLARRCKALGMEFGAWIGPTGFGQTDQSARQRLEELVAMVRDWHIGIFKIDTCVGPLMDDDVYANEWRMGWLAKALDACRAIRPNLVVINHRISCSPYMFVLLDSTLWQGAESYPDVFLNNHDRPRLHTRHAALGRGLPTYYGTYSPLLEDHGICFNGPLGGWREEFVVQTFGRALALSPEVYGNLHQLPDEDLAELGRLMQLARTHRELLAHTRYLPRTGDFLHADGTQALLCLVNDSWQTARRTVRIDESAGLARRAERYTARILFPKERLLGAAEDGTCQWGRRLAVALPPFGVMLVHIHPDRPEPPFAVGTWFQRNGGRLETLAVAAGSETWSIELGPLERLDPADAQQARDEILQAVELCRFAIPNDPPEWQDLAELAPSRLEEVNRCRDMFRQKLRREVLAVAANAWDGDERTAWSDFDTLGEQNVWRIDLGREHAVRRVEITLADVGVGPLIDRDDAGLDWPVAVEVSADLRRWTSGYVERYPIRQPFRRVRLGQVMADFASAPPARYVRIRARGFVCRDITVRAAVGDRLQAIPPEGWRGSNMWTMRRPKAVYQCCATIERTWPGRTLALVAELPDGLRFPHRQEHSFAWIDADGRCYPFVQASPRPAFHGWEHSPSAEVPGVTWRMPVGPELVGRPLRIRLAWIGPEKLTGPDRDALPRVTARLVADGIPFVVDGPSDRQAPGKAEVPPLG